MVTELARPLGIVCSLVLCTCANFGLGSCLQIRDSSTPSGASPHSAPSTQPGDQIQSPNAEVSWNKARQSISDLTRFPIYGGLHLKPQAGLVPIGRDPESGLWEFAHPPSGSVPGRNASGNLVLTPKCAIIFVLLPGGQFSMGALPAEDATRSPDLPLDSQALADEAPVRTVELDPFFLSKYELTQAQWLRLTGASPSFIATGRETGSGAIKSLHPVERVSWQTSEQVLAGFGLRLPTEAQWEYAARGGTITPWWTGAEKQSLAGAANLADRTLKSRWGPPGWRYEEWLDDGFPAHGPIGSFRANAFGLHDVAGNVAEWCNDNYVGYDQPVEPGTGERRIGSGIHRVVRGGSFRDPCDAARSAARRPTEPTEALEFVGLRPCRALEK